MTKTVTINELMSIVAEHGPITSNQICDLIDYPKKQFNATLYPKLNKLCKQGYLKKEILDVQKNCSRTLWYC